MLEGVSVMKTIAFIGAGNMAKAIIKGLSARETDEGTNRSADLQITDMLVAPVDATQQKSAADTLYGSAE